jgi:hypothetical protein
MEVRVMTGENFSLSSWPPGPGKVSMTVRCAKTRLQNRAMASLPRWMWSSNNSRVIPAYHWETGILAILRPLLKSLQLIGGGIPVSIYTSIREEFEYASVSYDPDIIKKNEAPANRQRIGTKDELLTLPPATLSNFEEDLPTLMRPCFDALARVGGIPGSPRYRK